MVAKSRSWSSVKKRRSRKDNKDWPRSACAYLNWKAMTMTSCKTKFVSSCWPNQRGLKSRKCEARRHCNHRTEEMIKTSCEVNFVSTSVRQLSKALWGDRCKATRPVDFGATNTLRETQMWWFRTGEGVLNTFKDVSWVKFNFAHEVWD